MRWVVVSHEAELVSRRSLAQRLNVSLQTVALWETKRPPGGIVLLRLSKLAEGHQYADLAKIFANAVEKEDRRVREQMNVELNLWDKLFTRLYHIQLQAHELTKVAPAVSDRILSLAKEAEELAEEARSRSWRNQR